MLGVRSRLRRRATAASRAAAQCGDGGRLIDACGLDIEGEGEAFLGAGKVEERRTDHALEHDEGVVQRLGAAGEPVNEVLVLVEGGEYGAVAPKEVDVA